MTRHRGGEVNDADGFPGTIDQVLSDPTRPARATTAIFNLAEIAALRAEVERLREALDAIERLDTDWTAAPDENLDRARFIARQALAHPEGETP